jgi:hypothetical protein
VKAGIALAAALMASLTAGEATAQVDARARMTTIMDSVFGPGTWRITGGYRSPEREDQLRRQGAMTVRAGGISRHSLGTPDAPGAYDIVVDGMSPFEAADRLQRAGAPFARYMPKSSHGSQGPHLHLEPYSFDLQSPGAGAPVFVQASYSRSPRRVRADGGSPILVVEGVARRRGAPEPEPEPAPSETAAAAAAAPAEDTLAQLRADARRDSAQAQLKLGQAYLAGEIAPRDVRAALKWIQLAASNPKADAQTRAEAATALENAAAGMEESYARRALQFAKQGR